MQAVNFTKDNLNAAFEYFKQFLNSCAGEKEPWQIISITSVSVLATVWLWECYDEREKLFSSGKDSLFRLIRKIPAVARRIDSEMTKAKTNFEDDMRKRNQTVSYTTKLPHKGKTPEEILHLVEEHLKCGEYKWKDGFVSGTVYYYDTNLVKLLTNVYGLASYTNPLHADVFPGISKMEAEVVRITANLFNGSSKSCGTMTSGGTESIIMACKAYRDYAIRERGIHNPEIVLPVTAHPAFDKASEYFGLRLKHIPVDPVKYAVDIKAMKRAISKRTCLLVGSVPNYPYGTMDDIQEIAALGRRYNIPVHVDSCLGGFVVAFMKSAGYELPAFDFSVPGVTSISADTHKYGFAPKGSSVILYSDPKFRNHQFFACTDWPGGVYGSPTVNGSRAGGIIAACWATLMYFGLNGYIEATKKIVETTKYIEDRLRQMNGLFVFGTPATSVIALGSDVFHIYRLSDALSERGWNLNPLQYPPGIHLCVTHVHTAEGVADRFISDVKEELDIIMQSPGKKLDGRMAMYGMCQSIPDRSIVGDFTRIFLDSLYYTPEEEDKKSSN